MILNKLFLANYRSCKSLSLDFDANIPNIYIGLNDCGKSTILHSIDLLLGAKPTYNSIIEGQNRSDLSNTPLTEAEFNTFLTNEGIPIIEYSENQTVIIGELEFNDSEVEDFKGLTLSNPLTWALENADENKFLIAKIYSTNSCQFLLLTKDDEDSKLWSLSAAELNKFLKAEDISAEDIQNENGKGRFSNMEKIRAGYSKKNLSPEWCDFKLAKSDKEVFPEFNYFDWNCSFDDINSLANSIMKEHIDEQLGPLKKRAISAANDVEKEINKKFGEISEVIQSVAKGVEKINSKVHFDVKERISDIMVQKLNSDGFIHLENQGEGLKRQIWFSLIKSKASVLGETKGNNFIWAFDEPETHLYPSAQRDFFDILNKISLGNVQTLISTHSTVFIDKSKIEKISHVRQLEDGYTEVSSCKDVEMIHSSLGVKNSDFLFYDKFLIVEGDTEQYLIPKLYKLYTGRDLLSDNIQLINIQGKDKWLMNKALMDKIMKGFKKTVENVIYLFDNDMSYEIGASAITENMFFVGTQDLEDSLEASYWVETLNEFFDGDLTFSVDEIDKLKSEVGTEAKCQSNRKFYKILEKHIVNKWQKSGKCIDELKNIPSKGIESADFLFKHVSDNKRIPLQIKNAFDKLLS